MFKLLFQESDQHVTLLFPFLKCKFLFYSFIHCSPIGAAEEIRTLKILFLGQARMPIPSQPHEVPGVY
jgi:hypothetical protein